MSATSMLGTDPLAGLSPVSIGVAVVLTAGTEANVSAVAVVVSVPGVVTGVAIGATAVKGCA